MIDRVQKKVSIVHEEVLLLSILVSYCFSFGMPWIEIFIQTKIYFFN